MSSKKTDSPPSLSPTALFWTKESYACVAREFHPFHQHDLNVALHLFTTGLGIWGTVQLAVESDVAKSIAGSISTYTNVVYAYMALIALTTPLRTALLHTVAVLGMLRFTVADMSVLIGIEIEPLYICIAAIVLGYGLQDFAHWICQEPTYIGSYINVKPWMLLVHSIWLLPLVIDAVLMRFCFIPYLVTRNRCVVTSVASRKAIDDLRAWISKNIPLIAETTHIWPHAQTVTSAAVKALEEDSAILAGFRKVFSSKHYDIRPVVEMNELYITAVGSKKEINSDAVFYTPHTDGPYWFLPGCSLYRVLVGVTPNQMVRTRFSLQHESQNQIVDMYSVLGFDYSRELHWIDHVPGAINTERRSLVKLHYIVYPKGWARYGKLAAKLNTNYNTWARGNFLQTLRPGGLYEYALAWWIWLTTWFNALFEEHIGWANLTYISAAFLMGPTAFLILTSFRHYAVYIATFAFRQPQVAIGYLMRDAKLYKTISMMHLARRVVPLIDLKKDWLGVLIACLGFSVTLMATARLGMVRTYFGVELGFVKPSWISGFPYGSFPFGIPHPMIMGQIFAFGTILYWFWNELSAGNSLLILVHIMCYTAHMLQEIFTSAY
jgi:hypothetical protein